MKAKYIKIDGLETCYYDEGQRDKTSLVFIHGNSQNSSSSFCEQFSDSSLNENYRMVAIDLYGHGKSERSNIYSLDFFVDQIQSVIEYLDLKKIIFIGHSLGGHIALELSERIRERLAGIFTFGTPPVYGATCLGEAFLSGPASGLLFKEELTVADEDLLLKEFCLEECYQEGVREALRESDCAFRKLLLASISNGEIKNEVSIVNDLEVPFLIALGEFDRFINLEFIENKKFDNLYQGAVQVISNAGHFPQLDQSESFNKLLLRFIDSTEVDSVLFKQKTPLQNGENVFL